MMSVNIVENWTDVEGEVLRLKSESEAPAFITVTLELRRVQPVAGFANLIDRREGDTLEVLFPSEIVHQLKLKGGDVLSCRVRKTGLQRCYVHRESVSVQS
jgi:hypothetical protein